MGLIHHFKQSFLGDFFSPAGYFFVGWIILYFLFGLAMDYRERRAFSLREGFKSSFPSKNFLGKSAKLDYLIFLFNHYFVFYFVGLLGLSSYLSKMPVPVSGGFWVDLIYTALILFVADLGWTIQHILFHRVSWLWEFHKVHHSATELNIFTIARLHPLDALSQGWFSAVCVWALMGICKALVGFTPSLVLFMNVSWAMALFRMFGIYRHSHIWIPYNRKLSHVLSSPAMHQIHHSNDERHFDKNFAVVFSFWDWVFGTLYIPLEKEPLRFGIEDEGQRKYDSFVNCLIHPFLPKN